MRRNVAVIGGGIAGIAAAELLQGTHEVTLYEASDRLGGHANPVTVQDPRAGEISVDTAFLIFNPASYPLFLKLLARWGLSSIPREAEMSFLVQDPGEKILYSVNHGWIPRLGSLRSLADPRFLGIFPQIKKFRRQGAADLASGSARGRTIEEYFESRGFSRYFLEHFALPIAMAVWSVPAEEILGFEAQSFLAFFGHHGYLEGFPAGRWHSLQGSSKRYLDAFRSRFRGKLRLSSPVRAIRRPSSGGAEVLVEGLNAPERHDLAVLATHADVSLRLLEEPRPLERELIGAWRYRHAAAALHSDASWLPTRRRLWASWNVLRGQGVTYWLNRVQGLEAERDYFVTLDGPEPRPETVLARFAYEHPILDSAAVATHPRLPELNGSGPIAFCGSYFGYGFHEDAIRSAARAAEALGAAGFLG